MISNLIFKEIVYLMIYLGPRSAVGNVSATDACLTADPGVASSIPARPILF